jgi:hypothetical protein
MSSCTASLGGDVVDGDGKGEREIGFRGCSLAGEGFGKMKVEV